jgi:hypothetical protein
MCMVFRRIFQIFPLNLTCQPKDISSLGYLILILTNFKALKAIIKLSLDL